MISATCIAPVNIAVIKYCKIALYSINISFWVTKLFIPGGKRDKHLILPYNDSISGTLSMEQVSSDWYAILLSLCASHLLCHFFFVKLIFMLILQYCFTTCVYVLYCDLILPNKLSLQMLLILRCAPRRLSRLRRILLTTNSGWMAQKHRLKLTNGWRIAWKHVSIDYSIFIKQLRLIHSVFSKSIGCQEEG